MILGAGGHARMLIEILQSHPGVEIIGLLDTNRALWGNRVLEVPVLGGDEHLATLTARGATAFVVGLGGVGDNEPRRRLFDLGRSSGLYPLQVRHHSALVSPHARLGDGVQLLPACVVNVGASIGDNVLVNSAALIEHDCVVGEDCHVAPGARLAANVILGRSVHVGAGASVRQGLRIGAGAIIGLGAAVVRDVAPGAVVVGVPARPISRVRTRTRRSNPRRA